jgi:hypothetical protein
MVRARYAVGRAAVGLLAFVALGVLWLSSLAASAQSGGGLSTSGLSMSRTLICDTAEEVGAYVGGDPSEEAAAALARVNQKYGKNACNVIATLFRRGEQANTVLLPDGIVRITKIEVYAVIANGSLTRLATPQIQYAPVFEKATRV